MLGEIETGEDKTEREIEREREKKLARTVGVRQRSTEPLEQQARKCKEGKDRKPGEVKLGGPSQVCFYSKKKPGSGV